MTRKFKPSKFEQMIYDLNAKTYSLLDNESALETLQHLDKKWAKEGEQ